MSKKTRCANCGTKELVNVHNRIALCITCETREVIGGEPHFDNEPFRCPACGNIEIETGLWPEEDITDEDAAWACGIDVNSPDLKWEALTRFAYNHEYAQCDRCDRAFSYGPRWYYNQKDNAYTNLKPDGMPLTPAEINAVQETEFGQLRLLDQ